MLNSLRTIFAPLTVIAVLCGWTNIINTARAAAAAAPQNEALIATIRSRFATINQNLGRYRKVRKDLEGESAEGGTLVAHLDGKSVRKVVATHYGETGRAIEEYYYWDDQLIFVLRKEFHYTRPLSGKVRSIAENRFYFDGGRLIRWLDQKRKTVRPEETGYGEQQEQLLNDARRFADMARS